MKASKSDIRAIREQAERVQALRREIRQHIRKAKRYGASRLLGRLAQ